MSTTTARRLARRRRLARNRRGVTLVELLIVLAVIGGLAVLYLVNTGGVFKTTADTQLQHDLMNAKTQATAYAMNHGLSYTGMDLTSANIVASDTSITPSVTNVTPTGATITMKHNGQNRTCTMTVGANESKPSCS